MHVPNEVKDTMRIEIVRNVDIYPKYKSLYLSSKEENNFQFSIKHGSGYFSVHLSSPELVKWTEREGVLTIVPLKEGSLSIKVEDMMIPGAE